jgi:hypothetical protein
MKLRIHGDSLRLRLNRSDVEQFRTSGVCAASLRFDSSSQLTYTLETSSQLTGMEVQYLQDCIRVLLPLDMAQEWAGSDRISLSLNRAGSPSLLIEKDFQCLHHDETNLADDADAFPNPAEDQRGAICLPEPAPVRESSCVEALLASSAISCGVAFPAIRARSISRPDIPNTSVATFANLMLAVSSTFSKRLRSAA